MARRAGGFNPVDGCDRRGRCGKAAEELGCDFGIESCEVTDICAADGEPRAVYVDTEAQFSIYHRGVLGECLDVRKHCSGGSGRDKHSRDAIMPIDNRCGSGEGLEMKSGNHAEGVSGAAKCKVDVRVSGRSCMDEASTGENDVKTDYRVQSQAPHPRV